MFEKQESKLGKTLEVYRKISVTLNSFPAGEKISVKDLATKSQVHWNTAKKALLFFNSIEPVIPKLRMESESKFQIIEKPDAVQAVEGIFESLEMRVIVKLMLKNALEQKTALKAEEFLDEEEKGVVQELVSKGFVNSIEGNFYLSKRGQSLASIGMRRLVELDITLPWEKPIEQELPKPIEKKMLQSTDFRSQYACMHMLGGPDQEGPESWGMPRRLYEKPEFAHAQENEGWQFDSEIHGEASSGTW